MHILRRALYSLCRLTVLCCAIPLGLQATLIRSGFLANTPGSGEKAITIPAGCYAFLIKAAAAEATKSLTVKQADYEGILSWSQMRNRFGVDEFRDLAQDKLFVPDGVTLTASTAWSNGIRFEIHRRDSWYVGRLNGLESNTNTHFSKLSEIEQKFINFEKRTNEELKAAVDALPQRILMNAVMQEMKSQIVASLKEENDALRGQVKELQARLAVLEAEAHH